MGVQRTDDYLRPRGYYDNQGNLLNVSFSAINDSLSGITVSAGQINYSTGFPASCAYAVSALTAQGAASASYAASAGNTDNAGASSIYFTPIGGMAYQFINKTGATSVYGTIVRADYTTQNAVALTVSNDYNPIGVMYSSSVANNATCLVVCYGKAQVLMNTNSPNGYWLGVGATTGYATAVVTSPAAGAMHDGEIGHCIVSAASGGLATLILHYR
jgi:hypothetical protein